MTDRTRAIPSPSETVRCHRCGSMRSAVGGICAECGASHEEWRQWRERGSAVWQSLDRKMRAATMGVVLAISLWIFSALAIAWIATNRPGDVSDELGAVLLHGLRQAQAMCRMSLAQCCFMDFGGQLSSARSCVPFVSTSPFERCLHG